MDRWVSLAECAATAVLGADEMARFREAASPDVVLELIQHPRGHVEAWQRERQLLAMLQGEREMHLEQREEVARLRRGGES